MARGLAHHLPPQLHPAQPRASPLHRQQMAQPLAGLVIGVRHGDDGRQLAHLHVHGHHVEHLARRLPSRAHASRLRVDDLRQPIGRPQRTACSRSPINSLIRSGDACAARRGLSRAVLPLPPAGGGDRLRRRRRGHLGVRLDRRCLPAADLRPRLFLLPTRRLHHAHRRGLQSRLRLRQRVPLARFQSLVLELRLSRRPPPRAQGALVPPAADPSIAGVDAW